MRVDEIVSLAESTKFNKTLRNICQVVSGRKDIPVILEYTDDSYTDNHKIQLGIPEFFTQDIYEEIDLRIYLKGIDIHESAHLKHSNFDDFNQYIKDIFIKYSTDSRFRGYVKSFTIIARILNNAIEDGRIELIESLRFYQNIKILKYTRSIWYKNCPIRIEEKDNEQRVNDLIFAMCSIATINQTPLDWEIVYWNTEEDELLKRCIPIINEAVIASSHKKLGEKCFEIMSILEDYLLDMLECDPNELNDDEKENKVKNNSQDDSNNKSSEGKGSNVDKNQSQDGNDEDSKNEGSNSKENVESDEDSNGEENNSCSNSSSNKNDTSKENNEESRKNAERNADELLKDMVKEKNHGISPLAQGSEFELSEEDREFISEFELDLDKYRDMMKEDLNKENNFNNKAKIKNKCDTEYVSMKGQEEQIVLKRYNLIPSVSPYGDEIYFFKKQIEDILKTKKNKVSRRRKHGLLDIKNIHEAEMGVENIFMKNKKGKESDFCVSILIDSSGSMNGPLMETAYKTCIVLEEVLKEIVPLQIAFFSTENYNCTHRIVKEFDSKFKEGSLVNSYNPEASGTNKDGLHIRYAIDELTKRNESNKFLIVLSDGLPSCYRGGLEEGIKDVKEVVSEGYKNGVKTICIAIGLTLETLKGHKPTYDRMYDNVIISVGKNIYSDLTLLIKRMF